MGHTPPAKNLRGFAVYRYWFAKAGRKPHQPYSICPVMLGKDGTVKEVLVDQELHVTSPPYGVLAGKYWWEGDMLRWELDEEVYRYLQDFGP